jgi:hypothetical protein
VGRSCRFGQELPAMNPHVPTMKQQAKAVVDALKAGNDFAKNGEIASLGR